MAKVVGPLARYPARVTFAVYLGLILAASLLLAHPVSRAAGRPAISPVDAAFTATSATCVTGLIVRSTPNDFNVIGQLVILLLIQLGGIGIMTVSTYVLFQLGGREGMQHRVLMTETLGTDTGMELRWVLRNVISTVLVIEGVGFVLLAARNLFDMPPLLALWHALFHSVSAFCNAGFALHDDNLMRYRDDVLVNLTISGLVIVGGIGFPILLDLRRHWLRGRPWRQRWELLHLHSKLTLIATCALLAASTACVTVIEWDGILNDVQPGKRPMVAFFHAVCCRTAGFNTIDLPELTNATLFISILLMAVGGGSASTAGGIKVSTIGVLVLHAWSMFRGKSRLNLFRRTVPRTSIAKAEALMVLFFVVAGTGLTLMLLFEESDRSYLETKGAFMATAFETVSALGTVGLSLGITPTLTLFGKMVIILLMFIGRLGPITVFAVVSSGERRPTLAYPDEEPICG